MRTLISTKNSLGKDMPLILNHPSFLTPEKEDKLWRYMEFAKFVSMITSKALWFSNAEVLARDDPFEGTLPKASFDHRQWKKGEDPFPAYFKAFGIDPESDVARLMRGTPPELRVVTQEQMVRFIYAQRRAYFLNCWHKSQIESAAMWKTYGKHDDAIAVTSSVAKMEYAFREVAAQIYCGSVEYIDFDSDHVRLDSIFNAILRKRKSFGYENEVRLLRVRTHNQ